MAAQNQKQSPKKSNQAEAAVAEVEPEERTITVEGEEYVIPAEQPSEMLFSARQMNKAQRTGDEGAAVEAMMDMAIAYIGEDSLRDILAGKTLEESVVIVEQILGDASESYGSDTGE